MIKNQRGQLSIFFAISIIFIVTAIAFVINVGLFVKAKINLQNAVDAAAWSGAAVQARQLTDIAYLNWEMRNVYKEWMFKYYVLGNLSVPKVKNPDLNIPNSPYSPGMDFTLQPATGIRVPANEFDRYNIPSVCLYIRGNEDLCSVYRIPGIPVLNVAGIPSMDEFTKELTDTIIKEKAAACMRHTSLNYKVAVNWAYKVSNQKPEEENVFSDVPQIALDRPGAWPRAIELALRIRNLEKLINTAPRNNTGVCASGDNCTAIDEIIEENNYGNERIVKAFYSAFRNLGNDQDRDLKYSFVLKELSPNPYESGEFNLSQLLIPENKRLKYYLDLKLSPINIATFYTALLPKTTQGRIDTEAECQMSKIAIPVPGYPFSFDKNPNFLTYYAVKGEAKFNGLFNPFSKEITLTAYAAAKPFGGRIGPKLFDTSNENYVTPRSDAESNRSSPYIFGIQTTGTLPSTFPPFLPFTPEFWVQNPEEPIGGFLGSEQLKYVVPNLSYNPLERDYYDENLYVMPMPNTGQKKYQSGLYNVDQFKRFKEDNLIQDNLNLLTQETLEQSLSNVLAPTPYEARNYLIPSPASLNNREDMRLDSFGFAEDKFEIFAPLWGPGLLYESPNDIIDILYRYVESQKPSVDKYLQKVDEIAEQLHNIPSTNQGGGNQFPYREAAAVLYDRPQLTCQSIAGSFAYYYLGAENGLVADTENICPRPLLESIREYYLSQEGDPTYYRRNWNDNLLKIKEVDENNIELFYSAYLPGPLSGGVSGTSGFVPNRLRPQAESVKSLRNFYSTKFISLPSLSPSGAYGQGLNYSEGRQVGSQTGGGLINPLTSLDDTRENIAP